MNTVVLIVGEGLLADFTCGALSTKYKVVRHKDVEEGPPAGVDLALVLHDTWQPSAHRQAEVVFQTAGIPWLRGFVSFGEAMIGPLVRPGVPGCSQCADIRHLMEQSERQEMAELQRNLAEQGGKPRDPWASRMGLWHVSRLLVAEVERVLEGSTIFPEDGVLFLNLKTLKSSRHSFLPSPLCPVCSRLPEDSATAAGISLQPSPKVSAGSFRCRSMDDMKQFLVKDYLDYKMGLLNGKMHSFLSPFATASVNLPLMTADEATAGRTHSYAESELTAILEGLERYCGIAPLGKSAGIRDSFRNLKDQALHPLKVGVHTKEQYALPNFPFKPFHPDRPIDWAWGYSFLQERPILVPRLLAYYSLGCGDGYVFETSNGCALGGSLAEAIFYGIMEVVERDSFLLTWYARLPLPRLDVRTADDQELQLMVDRVQAVAGYDLYLYNATMENGIPSIWALAKNRKHKGMNLICAAAAHLDPVRAAKGAIHELAGLMLTLDEKWAANRKEYEQMLHDSTLVQRMEDHSMLYGLPQAQERLQFLLDENRPVRTFDEEFKRNTHHADLTDDLKDMLQVFRELNLDVIVVDQTSPELARNGLHCVKVLIPGMLPMTFGHHLTRLEGLERVLRVPAELGYVQQPLTPNQLNPYPHPFP